MRDLLADLLAQATRKGATAADAFVVQDQSFSAQVRLGQVDTVKHARITAKLVAGVLGAVPRLRVLEPRDGGVPLGVVE